ncbi:MAG: DUF2851 family protein [Nitrospinales bacterium]
MESQVKEREERFSEVYLNFTHIYSQTRVQEEDRQVRIPEKVVRCIWNDQSIKTDELCTTDGEAVRVLFPGYWNFGGGPDFTGVVIKVNGKTYEGDAEIHVHARDWKAHKHSENPEYDNVILHVFMWKDKGKDNPIRSRRSRSSDAPGRPVFELELKNFLEKGILEISDNLDFDNYPIIHKFNHGLCHEPLARLPREKFAALLDLAGDARILTKMQRFHDRVIINGYEQTFYEGLAEALGYPNNKRPFQMLAEFLPLHTIKKLLPPDLTANEMALHIQAMLFGASGLIGFAAPDQHASAPADRRYFKKMSALWKQYAPRIGEPPMKKDHWHFGGIRPANYPYRRIAGLSRLLTRHWTKGIFADFLERFQSTLDAAGDQGCTSKTLKPFYHFFCMEAKDYWSVHYTPGGKELSTPQQLVGLSRSREITVNILIPLGLIYARAGKAHGLEKALKRLYQAGNKPLDNKLIRFMKHYILGNKPEMIALLKTDKETQGLIQVYQDYCTQNKNNCFRCQFPDVVDKYFS